MKCPKCGYHSFDYLESCKKCDNDLTAFKSKFNLRSLIFPNLTSPTGSAVLEDTALSERSSPPAPAAVAAATDFGFDFMDENSTPAGAAKTTFDLPELEEATAQTTDATLPIEGTTFSWSEDPQPETAETAAATGPAEDFDWTEEESTQDAIADEDEGIGEEAESDDTFGLDLSWDADLPALDEDPIEEEPPLDPMTTDDLPDWDFEEETPQETKKSHKTKDQEEPSDPFELRGEDEEILPPVSADLNQAAQAELPFDSEPDVAPTAHTNRMAAAVVPVSDLTAGAPWTVAEEEALTALEQLPPTDVGAPSTTSSPLARGLALVIDLLVLAVAILLFLMAGEAALAPTGTEHLLPSPEVLLNLAIPYFLVFFSVCFVYFTLFHFLTGQTPGKMFLRLRVETESGLPLTLSQAFLRSTGGLFSLLLLGLGFLAILFDRRRRGWNDRLAGTLVVSARTSSAPFDGTESSP